jgi:hypothetical protein
MVSFGAILIDADGNGFDPTVAEIVLEHPPASDTVTVYVPAARLLRSSVVTPPVQL